MTYDAVTRYKNGTMRVHFTKDDRHDIMQDIHDDIYVHFLWELENVDCAYVGYSEHFPWAVWTVYSYYTNKCYDVWEHDVQHAIYEGKPVYLKAREATEEELAIAFAE